MKIAIVSVSTIDPSRYGLTGETPFIELARSLSAMGHKVTAVNLANLASKPFEQVVEGVRVKVVFPFYISHIQEHGLSANIRMLETLRKYIDFFSKLDFEICHVQRNPLPIMMRPFIPGRKFVFEVLAPFVRMFDEFRIHQTASFPIRKPLLLERVFEKSAFAISDATVFLTASMRDIMRSWGLPIKKTAPVIPIGVNEKLFKPSENKMDRPTVVYEGSITPFRGIETLIDAFRIVKQRLPHTQLMIVGGTFPEYLEKLRSKVISLHLAGDVKITGYVPYKEVAKLLGEANVAVSPIPPLAVYKFGLPLKLLDYMASGLPVVATDGIDGHIEAVNAGCGILVPLSPSEMADGIIHFLKNRRAAEISGMVGRRIVEDHFTWDIAAKRYTELYSNLWGS